MLFELDWLNAEKEFRLSLYLNPNYATGHHWYATLLQYKGRIEEAVDEISRASDLDPLSVPILKDRGLILYYARRYEEAIILAKKALELEPGFVPAHRLLSLAYHGKGLIAEAISEHRRWAELNGNPAEEEIWLAYFNAASGNKAEALAVAQGMRPEQVRNGNLSRGIALVYAELGEKDLAFEWLKRAYESRAESLASMKVDPKMDTLRSDPRFAALLQKAGLDQ
jgi:tetratricopeptide (TPR) repeat protein